MLYRLAHYLRLTYFFVFKTTMHGVRLIALTPDNHVVLVRHSYGSPDWMFPGGGIGPGEDATSSGLRELHEEIGMTAHGIVTHFGDYVGKLGRADDLISVLIVRDVIFTPPAASYFMREIAAVQAFPLHDLPHDLSPATARRLAELQGQAEISRAW